MSKILLLIQSQADVDALPVASKAIKSRGCSGLWVLFSPAILVDNAAENAKHEANLTELRAAMKGCADREDFEGAKGYKVQLDALTLDRVAKVKDSWKSMTKEDQELAIDRVFGDFFRSQPAPNVRPEKMDDHYEGRNFFDALQAQRKKWFAEFMPGTFELAWPTSFSEQPQREHVPTTPANPASNRDVSQIAQPLPEKKPGGNPMFSDARYHELKKLTVDQLGVIAAKFPRLRPSGTHMQIAGQVWKAEREAAKA